MNREVHVRFSEGLAVRFRGATQLFPVLPTAWHRIQLTEKILDPFPTSEGLLLLRRRPLLFSLFCRLPAWPRGGAESGDTASTVRAEGLLKKSAVAFSLLEALTKEEIPPLPHLAKGGEGGFCGLAGPGFAEARLRLPAGERTFLNNPLSELRSRRTRVRLAGNPMDHAGAEMVLGPFAETKGPHLPGRNPAYLWNIRTWIPTFVGMTGGEKGGRWGKSGPESFFTICVLDGNGMTT